MKIYSDNSTESNRVIDYMDKFMEVSVVDDKTKVDEISKTYGPAPIIEINNQFFSFDQIESFLGEVI